MVNQEAIIRSSSVRRFLVRGGGNENGDPALRVSEMGAHGRGVREAKPPGRWRIFLKNKIIS